MLPNEGSKVEKPDERLIKAYPGGVGLGVGMPVTSRIVTCWDPGIHGIKPAFADLFGASQKIGQSFDGLNHFCLL